GFKDGAFYQARFNHPAGLAFDDAGERLFVADRDNHRIRVIFLHEDNRVETLAGTGQAGSADGPLTQASFNQPSALAFIPPDQLAVYDQGSGSLRLIDLKTKTVGPLGLSQDGKTALGPLGPVWNLLYRPADQSLYFSQPSDHSLRRMDLKTQKISVVLFNDLRLPSPKALCLSGDQLYVSEQDGPGVYEVKSHPNSGSTQEADSVAVAGKGDQIIELAESGGILYALQRGKAPLARILPQYQELNLPTPWGFLLDNHHPQVPPLLQFNAGQPVGWAAAPGKSGSLYLSQPDPDSCDILMLKDYDFESLWKARSVSDDGPHHPLTDFSYPPSKPAKTFRILVVGSSREVTAPSIPLNGGKPLDYNVSDQSMNSLRTDTFPKQLEFFLNTQAALEGVDSHFEVLTLAHPGRSPQFFSYYEVPPIVEKYQVDLVLVMESASLEEAYTEYFEKPLTPEGIPAYGTDLEYLLRSSADRIASGAPRRLFERCKKLGLVREEGTNRLDFSLFGDLLHSGDREIRDDLIEMLGLPLKLLSQKIKAKAPAEAGFPRLYLVYTPSRDQGSAMIDDYEFFWRDLADRTRLKLVNLSGAFNALKTSFAPVNEDCCHRHYTSYGNALIAYLLGNWLPSQAWAPSGFPRFTDYSSNGGLLSPMGYYNRLIAGGDDPGFRDGDFSSARFNHPAGMALDDRGERLFVADRDNHRIRVIYLHEDNRVETLAGTGQAGSADGPLAGASFNQPSVLAWLAGDRLAVFDGGDLRLREIDLGTGKVSTLGCDSPDCKTPKTPAVPLWNMAYRAKDDSLYFTEPQAQALQKMDLKTQSVSTVLFHDARLPQPKALCLTGDKLYVADQTLPTVYEMDPPSSPITPKPPFP
ncbi:MAG TPA: hypothetical protein VK859_11705, partial [bacterium]|nr:hypothetical protein [bacterium]